MRLGNTLKEPRPYSLPARDTMDVVGTSDLSSLLTTVRGVNPFDVSPGIQLIIEKLETRPKSANPYVQYTSTLNVEKGTIGKVVDQNGNTALHVAAGCGYTQTVEALLQECGASADPVNADGFTPLHLAAMNGHIECVQRLVSAGANPKLLVQYDNESSSCPFLRGRTSVFLAHWHQHPAVEALLLSMNACSIRPVGPTGEQDLWKSAAAGQDASVFAQLFDVLDCHNSGAVQPLELPCLMDALPALVDDLPAVLSHLLPPHAQMSPSQIFIFEGLVARDMAGASSTVATTTESTVTVLDRVLVAGHIRALRALKLDLAQYDPPLSLSVCTHEDSETTQVVLLLLQEAEARGRAAKALAAYQKRAKNKRVTQEALTARQAWIELRQALEDHDVAPLLE